MGKIQKVLDKNSEEVYPLTHERAVKDSNGVTAETKFARIELEVSDRPLYSGNPNNGAVLFSLADLYGANRIYYDFDVPSGKASYIEIMNSSNQQIAYIGKGSSSSGDLHYEGYYDIPSNFAYAKFTTTSTTHGESTVNRISAPPSSGYYESIQDKFDNTSKVVLYAGEPLNNDILFTKKELNGATTIHYDFTVPPSPASYIALLDPDGTMLGYFGKGSSGAGGTVYKGELELPVGFDTAKFVTTSSSPSLTTVNELSFHLTAEQNKEITIGIDKIDTLRTREALYVYPKIIRDTTGQEALVSYAFSVRHLQMRAGNTLVAVAKGYNLFAIKYNSYGDFVGSVIVNSFDILTYKADEDCFIALNVFSTDTTVTFDDDYMAKSGLKLYSDFDDMVKVNSAQIINRVYIPALQHGENKVIRIPSVKIMPNRKVLASYEVRDSLSDFSTSFLGYSIIDNGRLVEYGAVGPKETEEVRQFNPQIYTLWNGDILLLWTSNDGNDVCTIHYSISPDYGNTWSEPESLSGTIYNGENILTAPANGVWVDDKIMLPVYITPGVYDENEVRSGLMLLEPSNMSHTEKFVSDKIALNECNVFVDGDTAFLSARQETVSGQPTPFRRIYIIDTALSGSFVEKTEFYFFSKYRVICQESYFRDGDILYIGMADRNRNGISLYESQDLSRSYTKIVQVVDVTCGGYSCIDMTNNSMVFITEGADPKNGTGEYMFVDSIILRR